MPNSDDYHDERDRFRTERNDYREHGNNNMNGSYRDSNNSGYNKRKRDESEGHSNNNSSRYQNGHQSQYQRKPPIDLSAPIVYTFKVS